MYINKTISAFILTIYTLICLLPSGASAAALYKLAPGDELEILILNKPELNTKQVIGPNGQISLPLVDNRFAVAGMTLNDAQGLIKDVLAKKIKNPDIVVNLKPRNIFITQHFLKTDTMVYKEATTIEEARSYVGADYKKEIHFGDVIYVKIGEEPSWWDNNWVAIIAAVAVVVGIGVNIKTSN